MTENQGTEMTFMELLQNCPVVIPIIQRDYAQGRKDTEGGATYQEVRDGILAALYNAAVNGQEVILDYIYGSVDTERFLPIDGQQRLTTLFLLHWYFAATSDQLHGARELLLKFTYEIRDSAREFCHDLIEKVTDLTDIPGIAIRNASWFHNIYDKDPTVQAMLNMLDAIHTQFQDEDAGQCWQNLTTGRVVRFWGLTLEGFRLTDDLFIKMNARGKSLTRFETFKNELESALDNTSNIVLREQWKDKIDNEWLDFFWKNRASEAAEDRMFRFILFITRSLSATKGGYNAYNNLTNVRYNNDIKIACEEEHLSFLVDCLNRLPFFLKDPCFMELRPLFERLAGNAVGSRDLTFSERAKIYAAFRYLFIFNGDAGEYHGFERVLNNLITGQRELQPNRKQYESKLSAQNFGDFISSINELIEKSLASGGILQSLVSPDFSIKSMSYISHEVEKAKYVLNSDGSVNQERFQSIVDLEQSSVTRGLIHNLFLNGAPMLTQKQLDKLLVVKPSLLLRCIQSFSQTLLLERKYNGDGKYLARGKVDEDHYNNEAYYYKWFFGQNQSEFGDYLLTSESMNLSKSVRGFFKACSALTSQKIGDEIQQLLKQQIKEFAPNNMSYYFTKYEEFYGEDICVCLIPRDNSFAMRIPLKGQLETGAILYKGHYNPFHMAMKNILVKCESKIQVDSPVTQMDKYIDEWFPLTLSNGVALQLMKNGDWTVTLNDADISQEAHNLLMDDIVLKTDGKDCIQTACDFILKM